MKADSGLLKKLMVKAFTVLESALLSVCTLTSGFFKILVYRVKLCSHRPPSMHLGIGWIEKDPSDLSLKSSDKEDIFVGRNWKSLQIWTAVIASI